jgi:hypothetical protein
MAKISVNANMTVVGDVSPYSYQVAPKTWNSFGESEPRKQLKFGDAKEPQVCRFTSGQGKASAMKYFVYFTHAERQEWIQLTDATYAALKADKTMVLELKPIVVAAEPTKEEPKKATKEKAKA